VVVEAREGAMAVTGLHHVSIRVQDPEGSRRFYEDALGLSFMEIPVGEGTTGIWRGSPTEGTLLATQAGNTFVILSPPLEGTPDDDRFSAYRVGVDHLALGVDGREALEELAARLQTHGVETAGVETDPVLDKEYVCFRDPDNVQWEFYAG
jgi:glyoxylase I family protein